MNKPSFHFERRLWRVGYQVVAGVDEVGRGCFAGPVVAAAVVFQQGVSLQGYSLIKINDSKKLTSLQREKAAFWIKKNALSWGIGVGSVAEINRMGMSKATNSAFRRAISFANQKLDKRIDYLLIDAFYIPYVRELKVGIKSGIKERKNPRGLKNGSRQMPVINGDEKSLSIAAASIIAKVERDNFMEKISKTPKLKVYGWKKNKGYGTKKHQEAIIRYGLTRWHRKRFVETFLNNFSSFPSLSKT